MYARCSREEYAGELLANGDEPPTFTHLLEGDCDCGTEHRPVPVSASKNGSKNGTKAEAKVIRRTRWKIYWYDGTYQATHLRLDYDDGNKSYPWEREDGTTGLNGTQPSGMLYGAELVNKHTLDIPVVLVEGEKCADALRGHKIRLSLATVTGASQRPVTFQLLDDAVLKPLVNRRIYLWPDADQNGQGRFHMDWVAAKLRELGCRDVRIVEWSNGGLKDDAADFCALHDEQAVKELLKAARPYPGDAAERPGWKLEPLPDGAGYRVEKDGARFEVTDLRHGPAGGRGHVVITTPAGDVVPGRMELDSMSGRGQWETKLRKYDKNFEWGKWLDGACAQITEADKRLEDPAIELRSIIDTLDEAEEQFLLDPYILDGLPTFLFGIDGTMKSYLAEAALLSLTTGRRLIADARPACTMSVLFADFELEQKLHAKRMRELLGLPKGAGQDRYPAGLHYMKCEGTISTQIDRILREARRVHAGCVVIDSVSGAADGPLGDDETARSYYQHIGRLRLPTISIGHIPKNGNPDFPFGSIFWRALARMAWLVEPVETDLPGEHVKLTNKKNTSGSKVSGFGLCVDFSQDVVRISKEQINRHMSPQAKKIVDLLENRGEPATYAEIQLATNIEPKSSRPLVSQFPEIFASIPGEGRYPKARIGLRRWSPVEEAEGEDGDWEPSVVDGWEQQTWAPEED
jgi:hypothetical protein